ncbi:MAG TPA: hypothetical protein VGD84_01735, partial [Pseudonocardiaceae bacterium]
MRPSGLATRPGTTQRDDATRYLCAAAHLDPAFADAAIREFLTEPLRAIPSSPAVDAPTVLREAVAARRRRLLRDWSLVVILILFAFSGIGIAIAWFVFGIAWSAIGSARSGTRSHNNKLLWGLGLVLAAIVLLSLAPRLISDAVGTLAVGALTGATPTLPSLTVGPFSVLFALLALVVIVLDKFALSYLLTRSFQRGAFVPMPTVDTWPGERWVRTVGAIDHERELGRVARADRAGNLMAYRGYEPFVGTGIRGEPLAMPIPLEPAKPDDDEDDDTPPEPESFTLAELYDHVGEQLMELRDSPSLAPSARLAGLTEREQVVVPIAELLVNFADPATRIVLPGLDQPPRPTLPPDVLADLIEHPVEWMRYYRCFQLETWNRDVTVSMFLHLGADERMLYLEWIPFVLYPIAAQYRVVDQMPVEPLGPLRDGLVEWLRLPGALLGRLRGLFTWIRPIPTKPGLIKPAKYGTSYSLRELAASTATNNYFQDAD